MQSSDVRGFIEAEVERRTVRSADTHPSSRHVVIVGEKPIKSAPTLTLSKALERLGVQVRFADANATQRAPWIRLLRSARAVLLVSYNEVGSYVLSQLALAAAVGVPVVRWWVGTDVLNVISRDALLRNAASVDRIVSTNVAAAPHLVDELRTAGIHAQFVPSVIDADVSQSAVMDWSGPTRPILVYMPESRKEFFGIDVIEPAIRENPDLTFLVVADESHSLALYPNVESFGWVSEMGHLYERAGCIPARDGARWASTNADRIDGAGRVCDLFVAPPRQLASAHERRDQRRAGALSRGIDAEHGRAPRHAPDAATAARPADVERDLRSDDAAEAAHRRSEARDAVKAPRGGPPLAPR